MNDDASPLPEYADLVLSVAERIPPGRVLTYGDVAELVREEAAGAASADQGDDRRPVGGGPRQVGRVMALYGGAAPWWRVVRADGKVLPGHELDALAEYRAEGTPLRERSAASAEIPRIDLVRARWDGGAGGDGDSGGAHS